MTIHAYHHPAVHIRYAVKLAIHLPVPACPITWAVHQIAVPSVQSAPNALPNLLVSMSAALTHVLDHVASLPFVTWSIIRQCVVALVATPAIHSPVVIQCQVRNDHRLFFCRCRTQCVCVYFTRYVRMLWKWAVRNPIRILWPWFISHITFNQHPNLYIVPIVSL